MREDPTKSRVVRLRAEVKGEDVRLLEAFVDSKGLHINGHDIGPGTLFISTDGEYEWHRTIVPADISRLIELLDGQPTEGIMEVLDRWVGKAYELETRLRESDIPSNMVTWRH